MPFGVSMVGAGDLHLRDRRRRRSASCRRLCSGDIWWCQGYSEPGAGSDLASLTHAERIAATTATTTSSTARRPGPPMAQFADWGFFLVRTDPDAKPQAGISFLLIDMKSPGVTVRPIITLERRARGERRLPRQRQGAGRAADLRGEPGLDGAPSSCSATSAPASPAVARSRRAIEHLRSIASTESGDDAQPLLKDPLFKRKVAELEIDLSALEYTELRTAGGGRRRQGAGAGVVAPEDQGHRDPAADQRTGARGRRPLRRALPAWVPGRRQPLPDRPGLRPRASPPIYFNGRKTSIYGGSNEIQRNIIAKMVLGL